MRKPASDVAGIEEVNALQTQVNNSAVGTNLIVQSDLKPGYLNGGRGVGDANDFYSDNYIPTNGLTVFTLSSPDYAFKGSHNHVLAMYDSNKNYLGYQNMTSSAQTLSKPNVAYIRLSINFFDEGGTSENLSDWLDNHRYKLEKGSVATDWCPNPAEILTKADDSKVAHLSGANNFDAVPTYGTNNKPFAINDNGATSARPTGQAVGYQYFDTTLNKPIWYTGTIWVDSTGATV